MSTTACSLFCKHAYRPTFCQTCFRPEAEHAKAETETRPRRVSADVEAREQELSELDDRQIAETGAAIFRHFHDNAHSHKEFTGWPTEGQLARDMFNIDTRKANAYLIHGQYDKAVECAHKTWSHEEEAEWQRSNWSKDTASWAHRKPAPAFPPKLARQMT